MAAARGGVPPLIRARNKKHTLSKRHVISTAVGSSVTVCEPLACKIRFRERKVIGSCMLMLMSGGDDVGPSYECIIEIRRDYMTTTGHATVVGVFEDYAAAERTINELRRAGFNDDQIGYVVRDIRDTTSTVTGGQKTLAGEGAATGAISGGVVGGVLGAAAALLIPGFGPAIAGGILATTLGGAAIGAAAGGILGALAGMGRSEEHTSELQSAFEAGRLLVTVQAPGRQREALDI